MLDLNKSNINNLSLIKEMLKMGEDNDVVKSELVDCLV
jgi:hypothetical protein